MGNFAAHDSTSSAALPTPSPTPRAPACAAAQRSTPRTLFDDLQFAASASARLRRGARHTNVRDTRARARQVGALLVLRRARRDDAVERGEPPRNAVGSSSTGTTAAPAMAPRPRRGCRARRRGSAAPAALARLLRVTSYAPQLNLGETPRRHRRTGGSRPGPRAACIGADAWRAARASSPARPLDRHADRLRVEQVRRAGGRSRRHFASDIGDSVAACASVEAADSTPRRCSPTIGFRTSASGDTERRRERGAGPVLKAVAPGMVRAARPD